MTALWTSEQLAAVLGSVLALAGQSSLAHSLRQDGMTDMRRHLLHRQPIPLMSPTSKSLN